MEVMSDRNDDFLWGARAPIPNPHPHHSALHRSESAPQSILLEASSNSKSANATTSQFLNNYSLSGLNTTSSSTPGAGASGSASSNGGGGAPSYTFLDSPNDQHRQVTFGLDTMFLEDDDEEDPDYLFPNHNTPRRTLAEIHSSSNFRRNRPPTQPARRHPARSVSSIELAGILNDRSKLGLTAAPPRERLLRSLTGNNPGATTSTGNNEANTANGNPSATANAGTSSKPSDKFNPFWPKSVFDMIQDDFPRTPSPMLSSLVPSKTVSTALSCANLDQEYDLFGNNNPTTKDSSNDASTTQNQSKAKSSQLTKDFDAIFNSIDDTPAPSRPARGHRRSVSINWTGDIPGLFEEQQQQPRSALKSSKSSYLFPTLSSSPPENPPSILKKPSVDGSSTPPRGSIAALSQQNSNSHQHQHNRPASPLNRQPASLQPDIGLNESEPQIVPDQPSHHQHDAATHAAEQATPNNFDLNYLYNRQDAGAQFTNQMLPTPHIPPPSQAQPYSSNFQDNFQAFPQAPNYGHSHRDDMAAANDLKTMSMQMAMFLHQQQQFYAAQMAQMAAITGNQFNPNLFNPSNMANMFANNFPVQHQQQNSPTHLRQNWDHDNQRGTPRGSRAYFDPTKKKDGSGGKSRGGRGRRNNRATHDGDNRNGSQPLSDNHARSPLLEEFRSSSVSIGRGLGADFSLPNGIGAGSPGNNAHAQREWALAEIKGHIVEFATDQHGSRFIQQKLEMCSDEEKRAVLDEAMAEAQRLKTDVFGNYVVQKLLDHGGDTAIKAISSELEGRMLSLSLHMYGCRVVQKALEVLESPERSKLVRELDGHVLKCIRDQNGNHVIQKCVELVEPNAAQFIVDAVLGHAVPLAGHSYGCRVVQRILEHGAPDQKGPVMKEIMSNIPELIKDQYGNYVIQHVVEHGDDTERAVIMRLVKAEVCQLSQHKFASNVVERCLQFGSNEQREILVEKLTNGEGGGGGVSPLNSLVRDQFGNYVVQRVLDVAKPAQRERVAAILKSQVPAIKKYSYGKHIIARLEDGQHGQAQGQGHVYP